MAKAARTTKVPAIQELLVGEVTSQIHRIAASRIEIDQADMDRAIETSQPVKVASDAIQLHLQQHPAECYASAAGLVRSNLAGQLYSAVAAEDHQLPSPRFEAFHVTFSPITMSVTCIPVARYEKKENIYRVEWAPNGREWRCDMTDLLSEQGWMPPIRKEYVVPITIRRHHPTTGTALLLWFKHAELVDSRHVRQKKAEEAAAAKAAAEAKAKAAKEAEATAKAAKTTQAQAKATAAKAAEAEAEEIEDEELEDEEE